MKAIRNLLLSTTLVFSPGLLCAESGYSGIGTAVRIEGRSEAVVTTDNIRLADLAEVTSARPEDDEIVIGLKRLNIASSPLPGAETTLTAAQILERIRAEGVKLNDVGYTLPRVIKVTRAARPVTGDEILRALNSYLDRSGRAMKVQRIHYDGSALIAPGDVDFTVALQEGGRPARPTFLVSAQVPGVPAVDFRIDADVEEWRDVPVAGKQVSRGSVVGTGDVAMARLNVAALSADALLDQDQVLGMEASQSIAAGEPFSRAKLVVPPIVASGDRVTMVYKSKLLQATATGIALDSGLTGETIRIKNDSSKKIISASVVEPGLVEVRP